ncbi:MAG: hypothetical protein J6D47_13880 [Peptostreptococcaceae bacterium]|nr:hypothetical protein [Peptostreptococcaceae bacterium]MBP3930636.1 hypothetical protein [Peptostreptococcaceae bacterium]
MGTYYLLESSEECMLGVYVGCDPNLKYQRCIVLDENSQDNKFKVKFINDYVGNLEVSINKNDIFLA